MEKYGVTTDTEREKVASKEGRPCPDCGSGKVDYAGSTPHCPNCGTKPWEPHGEERKRR